MREGGGKAYHKKIKGKEDYNDWKAYRENKRGWDNPMRRSTY